MSYAVSRGEGNCPGEMFGANMPRGEMSGSRRGWRYQIIYNQGYYLVALCSAIC